jgi:hypothetical protein
MPRSTTKAAKTDTTATKRAARTATKPARKPRTTRKAPSGAGVTHEQIAMRAYEIHLSGTGGDAVEQWLRAERELTAA